MLTSSLITRFGICTQRPVSVEGGDREVTTREYDDGAWAEKWARWEEQVYGLTLSRRE